jgi:hypothetical protein
VKYLTSLAIVLLSGGVVFAQDARPRHNLLHRRQTAQSPAATCDQNAKQPDSAAAEAKDGFVRLFDGVSHAGWQGDLKGYPIKDGVMTCEKGKDIFTAKEYANFVLRFEFKLPPAGNNGVSIRTPLNSKLPSAYSGMEIQILDDGDPKYKDLHDYQAHGSIYGVVAAKRGFLKPVGQWNSEEIVADGGHIKVTLNGTVILDADISKIDKTVDGQKHPGLHNAKGYIGWAGHGDPVSFRNVRIKELP